MRSGAAMLPTAEESLEYFTRLSLPVADDGVTRESVHVVPLDPPPAEWDVSSDEDDPDSEEELDGGTSDGELEAPSSPVPDEVTNSSAPQGTGASQLNPPAPALHVCDTIADVKAVRAGCKQAYRNGAKPVKLVQSSQKQAGMRKRAVNREVMHVGINQPMPRGGLNVRM